MREYKNCIVEVLAGASAALSATAALATVLLVSAGTSVPGVAEGAQPTTLEASAFSSAPAGLASIPSAERREDASASGAGETAADASRFSLTLLGSYRKSMEIEKLIQQACDTYGVPMALARAVCMYESGANDNLTSGAGARGYFQVMPATHRLLKVDTNIEAGVKYLSWLLRDFGREDDALAAYNGGPRRLKGSRPLPIETLQYVVGVGTYRTLLTREEESIRDDARRLDLYTVVDKDDWASISARTGIPVIELRMYNAYQALRPLRPGSRIAYPASSTGPILLAHRPGESGPTYLTRRGDNYLMLAFALGVDLDRFRADNALWRVQVPFEGMRLVVTERQDPKAETPTPPARVSQAAPAPALLAAPAPIVHKVRRGETLQMIANRYDVSADTIANANKLTRRSRLIAGQILKIPPEAAR